MCCLEGHAANLEKCQKLNKKQGNTNQIRTEQALPRTAPGPAAEEHPRGREVPLRSNYGSARRYCQNMALLLQKSCLLMDNLISSAASALSCSGRFPHFFLQH